MILTPTVQNILSTYESETPGVKTNLARLLMHGQLAGTGKLVILPIDQGFEHGPARSFAVNPDAYDPAFHYNMAVEAGLSAFAAPLGMLESCASTYAGRVPLILKMNSGNSLCRFKENPNQAITSSIKDALRLGCVGIGYTLYPGSDAMYDMQNDLRDLIREAREYGLFSVVWCYVRGGNISKNGETALDTIAYGAHIASLMGAHLIKVKLPTDYLEQEPAKKAYLENKVPIATLEDRVRHVVQSCFNGRRMVVFSGGEAKDAESVLTEAKAIRNGGGNGSIMGRNAFQRPKAEAMTLLKNVIDIYKEPSSLRKAV